MPKKIELKNKKVLVYDHGLFVSMAEMLVGKFAEVGYFCDWEKCFPTGSELMIGEGVPGITRVRDFWSVVDDYDLIVFPFVMNGALQEFLRGRNRARIWGSGAGASLELKRWGTRHAMVGQGLPSHKAERIIGIENLRSYLNKHENQYVKISIFRGLGETWKSINGELSQTQLDWMESTYGPRKNLIPFIVESEIPDAVEVGYDGFCIDGQFPKTAIVGVEVKDAAYLGAVTDYNELPESVRTVNDKLSPLMKKLGYRNFFSTEIRDNGEPHVIDLTCRHASPAGEVYCQLFKNLDQILWAGAAGELVEPEIEEKYGAQIILTSEWAEQGWQPIHIEDRDRPFVKIFNHCVVDGVDYSVLQESKMTQFGSVVGIGSTVKEAVKNANAVAERVKGFKVQFDASALDGAIEDMEKLGVTDASAA